MCITNESHFTLNHYLSTQRGLKSDTLYPHPLQVLSLLAFLSCSDVGFTPGLCGIAVIHPPSSVVLGANQSGVGLLPKITQCQTKLNLSI